jgi:S1-C subfamily serine protease
MNPSNESIDVLNTFSQQLADAVERISPALVLVNGRQRYPASGVVVAPDTVLTADHVLEREEELTIQTHDGRTLAAQFVGRDPATDLALLRVAGLAIEPASTVDLPRVGQFILAVGRPTADGPMASIGIVSAVGGPLRTGRGAMLETYIRTDATPYPGFSGGPLIDTQGAVVGILTTGLVNGAALAIPASIAWRISETIANHGVVKRGYLGISCQPAPLPVAQRAGRTQEIGLLIVRVEENSPAEQGGLLLGDVIVALAGKPVSDTDDLQAMLTGDHVGVPLAVEIIRGGVSQTINVTVGQRN